MFKLLKGIIKAIIITLVVILIIPVTFLVLFYKSTIVPIEDYQTTSTVTLVDMIEDDFNLFLEDTSKPLVINLEKKEVNQLIRNQLVTSLNGDASELSYVVKETNYGIQGAWVTVDEDGFIIHFGAHFFLGSLTYKTSGSLNFKLTDNDDGTYIFKLEKIKIGKVSMNWFISVADWILSKTYEGGIDQMVNDALGDVGVFDLSERTLIVDIKSLVENQTKNDPKLAAASRLLFNVVYEQDLANLELAIDEFMLNANLNKLVDNQGVVVIDDANRINNDAEMKVVVASKGNSLLVSLLNNESYIDLDSFTLNRVLEYFIRTSGGFLPDGRVYEADLFGDYAIVILMPFASIDASFLVQVPIQIYDKNDASKVFKSQLLIQTTPSFVENDLVLSISSVDMGELNIGDEEMTDLITILGQASIFQTDKIVLENFKEKLSYQNVTIDEITLHPNSLRLHVTVEGTNVAGIKAAIVTGLQDVVLQNPELAADVQEVIDLISQEDPQAVIDQLNQHIQSLSDQEQETIFNILNDALIDSGIILE